MDNINGYRVIMYEYYDDFGAGGRSEIFDATFKTKHLAQEQFLACKKYITQTKIEYMEKHCHKHGQIFGSPLKEAIAKYKQFWHCESTIGFAISDDCYWGTEVLMFPTKYETKIKRTF